jgi:hypothetical protein
MLALPGNVRLVDVQFSFFNPEYVPPSIRRERETPKQQRERMLRPRSGVMVIPPTEECSLRDLLRGIEGAGYEMVDAFSQTRENEKQINKKHPGRKILYSMVRFEFARSEFAQVTNGFRIARGIIRDELQEMCESALWLATVFSNPFFQNGEEIPGLRTGSIALTARKPLLLPDGMPVTARLKVDGRPVGDPVPIAPKFNLRVTEEGIHLVAK